jgi:transglutaminase-like putative cysteine protease
MTNGESENLNSGEAPQPRVRRYAITHVTDYVYSSESSLCHNQLHLRPRELSYQRTLHSQVEVTPPPDYRVKGIDAFGNLTEFYSIERIHASMRVVSKCEVERESVSFASQPGAGAPSGLPQGLPVSELHRWTACARSGFGGGAGSVGRGDLEAMEYLYPSRYCQPHEDFRKFVDAIWDPQIDSLQFALALNRKIYEEFRYEPSSTQVSTPPRVSLEKRQGVCQDFAHVMISCFRTMGLAARYVSGYLQTVPPLGKPRLVGADASHAWVAVFLGPLGWLDLDPTNCVIPGLDHITIGWGRDYSDVPPVQGVFVGGGFTSLQVSVDVLPISQE